MKKRDFLILTLLITIFLPAQEKKDSLKEIKAIVISAKAPISKEKINQKQIEKKNLGQDIPYLIKNNLSVVTTSDAGAGVGYTGLRIRGSDQTRINLTLDGVPVNDAESQGPFWINMPDLVSSISDMTIQRGVGTSTEGTGSFGASINLRTQSPSETPYFQTDQSIGSYNTHKHTFSLGTGKFANQTITMDARVSFIKSDGYIDRAFSDLFSYYTKAEYKKSKTKIGIMSFGGNQKTYQAWNGIDAETMKKRRTFNPSGAIYDEQGNIVRFYNNETDNYKQNHYHVYYDQELDEHWKVNNTLFFTTGKGYYEEYKQNAQLSDYKLSPIHIGNQTITSTDLIRRQWLKNDFYGLSTHLLGNYEKWNFELGLSANTYIGNHFGNVIWARYFSDGELDHEYYRDQAKKNEIGGYLKALYKLDSWTFFGDIQYRNIHYNGHDKPGGESIFKNGGPLLFSENYNFINPKIGGSYKINGGEIYLTYGIAQREPNRDDILNNANVKSEFMHNVELGIQQAQSDFSYSANWYGMYYINQLVLSGKINDVGSFIRENSGKSFRTGIELSAAYKLTKRLTINANSTISINKNIDYKKQQDSQIINLGNTDIAFSPNYIGNLILEWNPIKSVNISLMNQYISNQYLSNENPIGSKLPGYFTSDMTIEYTTRILSAQKFTIKLLLNNLFNKEYISNGYYVADTAYYYPQAGFNFLLGGTIKW